MNWYLEVLKKYAVFSGRARRKEFWMFALFYVIFAIVAGILDKVLTGKSILGTIYTLAMIVPSLAVTVRRLHDIGKSGLFILINLIPCIGWIWAIVLACTDSQPGENQYGPNPKEVV